MSGYLSIFAPDYKVAPQNRTRMNGKGEEVEVGRGLCQSKENGFDDRSSASNSRNEGIRSTSFGFDEDCGTSTQRIPGMMLGGAAPSTRRSHLLSNSSSPPHVAFASGSSAKATDCEFAPSDGHVYNAECCVDRFQPDSLLAEAERRQRNSRSKGCGHQDSEYDWHGSMNQECRAQESTACQGQDFREDCRSKNLRGQDAQLICQNPRSNYFLNLSAMDRTSEQLQHETRKLSSTSGKSSASKSADQGSRTGQTPQLNTRNVHRKNLTHDDQSVSSPVTDAAFQRGGVRRSLQLPRDRSSVSCRILPGISPLCSERNRSFRASNLSSVGSSSQSVSAVRSPAMGREKAEDKRTGFNSLSGTLRTPWPRPRKASDEDNALQDEDEDEGREYTRMKVRFQAIYGTIRRKCKLNQRNAEPSSSKRNGSGSLTQSTSLAQLSQKPSTHDAMRVSASPSPTYPLRSGADRRVEWDDQLYDSRMNRVYGSMSPMFSPSGKPKTGIPMPVGQQVAGGMAQSTISLSTKHNDLTNTMHRKVNRVSSGGGHKLHGALHAEDERDTDATSELSDGISFFSMNGSTLMVDVLNNLTSSTASFRKDGLSDLQYLLHSGAVLSKKDVKRLTEIFTRMFHDPQAKVFSLFLEILVDFINFVAEDLEEWIPICLNRLLTKVGADLLGSVHMKVQRALKTVRDTFPCDMQMYALARFVAEPSQTSNIKVKEAVLSHLHELILSMSPSDLSSDMDHQLLWTQLINWSLDSKSPETRKSAQQLIIAMFNLNPPVFSIVLAKQPKTSQDFVRKILHSHLRMTSNSIEEDDETESDAHTVQESRSKFERRNVALHKDSIGRLSQKHQRKAIQQLVYDAPDSEKRSVRTNDLKSQKSRKMDDASHDMCSRDVGLRRREPKKTSSLERQQLQINRMSEDSGIYFGSDETRDEFSPVFSPEDKEPGFYDINQNSITDEAGNQEQLDENDWWIERPKKLWASGKINPWIMDVVSTFSDTSAGEEKRKQAMKQLIQALPDNYEEIAESNLKTMLGVLLLTAGGSDEVSELADECISLLLKTQTSVKRIDILRDLADTSDFPINLAALKLQYSELQNLEPNDVSQILTNLVPSLTKAYENNESRVRKASLLSLVHLHKVKGEDIWQYISNMNENKQNLLMMYFRRTCPDKVYSTHL